MTRTVRALAALALTLALGLGFALSGSPAQADNELVFGGFGGTFQKELEATVIRAFEKKYGVKVIYVAGTSAQLNARVLANPSNPGIDIIWCTDSSYYIGRKAGLFAPLDKARIPNLAELYPFAVYPDGIGVMMGIQAFGIEYNTKVFAEKGWAAPTSWNDLWDPKYKGHVAAYNLPIGYATVFFSVVAEMTGSKPGNYEPAWAKIAEFVPNVLTFVNPPAQLDALFATGGAWIGFNGSARIGELAARGVPVALANPKEGSVLNPNQFVIVKNGPNSDLAHKFIDFALAAEAQHDIAKTMMLGPVNKNVKLEPEIAATVPYGDAVAKLWAIPQDPINEDMTELTQRWTTVVSKK